MDIEVKREKLNISVRALVEFILRSGDIDNSRRATSENAMLEGGRIHRMIQRRMGGDYRAEVMLSLEIERTDYDIILEGRADGIFTNDEGVIFVDEIKGVYRDLKRMSTPVEVHLAQAKCYAAIYLLENDINVIGVQMTYCNMDTEDIRRFSDIYDRDELLEWFDALIGEYSKWADYRTEWKRIRQQSIHGLEFPFEYREGQKELAASVYRTMYLKKRLFLEAPTGVGKTISTIFPAIKAIGEGHGEMIFYLTAKTLTGTVATDTYNLLRNAGLKFKTVNITAKEKMCPMEEVDCNPDSCPYAKGHFDRINTAIYELLTKEDNFSRDTILEYANMHMVCPFEFCLDMSLFSDGVICDYNYVFDPNVYLRRFFQDKSKGDYLFLVDEAHNLVDRAREMYSAKLSKDDFLELNRVVKLFDKRLSKALGSCNKIMLNYMRESGEFARLPHIDDFIIALTRLAGCMDEFLEDDDGSLVRKQVLELYFEVRHFLNMSELLDTGYEIYASTNADGSFFIKLLCVDPSSNIRACLDRGRSSIFFSATLLPVTYYIDLITGDRNDYTVYAKSSFEPEKRGVFIANDVSSKYKRRGVSEYNKIADYIHNIISAKRGNYMVFFPSYRFMEEVYDIYIDKYTTIYSEGFLANPLDTEFVTTDIICQAPMMTESDREEFLGKFNEERTESLLGFCVMGGIFSEGIDLKEESLIGAIIVGTGLPQVGYELELIKSYFGRSGFDFAYRYPGMNKVLQAAGRVIRTAEDVGIVALLDERFDSYEYRNLYPVEWKDIKIGNMQKITDDINEFWHKF